MSGVDKMKAKYVIAVVVTLAILIGTVSGYAVSETFFDKSIKGDFDLKEKIDTAKFEAKAESMGMTVEEFKSFLVEEFESKAENMDMTVEEYKEYLAQQEKEQYKQFEEKADLLEQYEAKAESMGMTISEYKDYLAEQKNGK